MGKIKTTLGLSALGVTAILGLLIAFLGIVAVALMPALLGGLIGWILWNHALAALFHGPQINYLQVVGVLWLAGVLTGIVRAIFR